MPLTLSVAFHPPDTAPLPPDVHTALTPSVRTTKLAEADATASWASPAVASGVLAVKDVDCTSDQRTLTEVRGTPPSVGARGVWAVAGGMYVATTVTVVPPAAGEVDGLTDWIEAVRASIVVDVSNGTLPCSEGVIVMLAVPAVDGAGRLREMTRL